MRTIHHPLVLSCLLAASENINDYQVVQEMLSCLRKLYGYLGNDFCLFLHQETVPNYFHANNSEEIINLLLISDFKVHKEQIKQLLTQFKIQNV